MPAGTPSLKPIPVKVLYLKQGGVLVFHNQLHKTLYVLTYTSFISTKILICIYTYQHKRWLQICKPNFIHTPRAPNLLNPVPYTKENHTICKLHTTNSLIKMNSDRTAHTNHLKRIQGKWPVGSNKRHLLAPIEDHFGVGYLAETLSSHNCAYKHKFIYHKE